ncbi:MAG: hypothetical protein NVSMB48_14780 [Marmoricola sp.]
MATATMAKTDWHLVGYEVGTCNCDWACPCQFNDVKPTHGYCEALSAFVIDEGHFGDVDLSNVKFAAIFHWPGAVHLGDGTRMGVVDIDTTPEQREALAAISSGTQGHPFFEIFASVTPHVLDPVVAKIDVDFDMDARTAHVVIDGVAENTVGPIPSVVGDPHRVRLELPNGFEFKVAEIANAESWHVDGPPPLNFRHERTYTQICKVDWDSSGATR